MSAVLASLGPHWTFIVAAYAITALTILGLALWIVVDGRALRHRLAELEARGIRRRSDRTEARP